MMSVLKRLAEETARRPFVRNVAAVASGTAATQAVSIAFSPFITRIYGPETYGVQGVFNSVAGILATVAGLSYPIAIVLPRSDADALGIARLSMYVSVAMAALTSLALYFFGTELLALMDAKSISALIYLLPVAMLISVFGAVTGQWGIREGAFVLAAKVSVAATFTIGMAKIVVGYLHPTAMVLVTANLVGSLFGAMLLLVGLRAMSAPGKAPPNPQAQPSAWEIAKRHADFALMRTPQTLINAVSHSLPVMMLATYFGSASVGFYAIASSVLAVPAGLIGNSVMQVFYPRINEAIHNGEDAKRLIVRATRAMALTGALPFAIVMITGPMMFRLVFGAEWRTAGVYAQWLAPWLFFQYINKPAVSAIPGLRLQGGLLIYELFSTGTKLFALYLGYVVLGSDVAAIALFAVFGVLAYAWLIVWVIYRSGQISPQPLSCP